MEFIRAPYVERVYGGTEILSAADGKIYMNQTALSFHPELTGDDRIHRLCGKKK
mgnify:CR=1 FL=1